MSTTGYPAATPVWIASRMPFSTAGMYSLGMRPCVTLSSRMKPLPRQPLQRHAELLLVDLRLRFDGDRDHRLGERDRLEQDRVCLVTKGVAGRGHLQPDCGRDVAREDLVDVLAADGVHAQDAADSLALAGRC